VRVDIDGCHRIGRKSAAYLRRRWVSNVVRLVKSDDARLPEIDWSNTDADDDDLGQLAGALPGNTRVNAIQIAHNRLVGDAGAEALWSVLPLCNVVGVALDVTSVAEPRKAAIRCLCVANAARRLAANDSSLTSLDWRVMRHTAVDADIMTIARAMRGNTALRVVRLGGNRQLSLEPPYLQPAKEALERSLVVRLDMDGTGIDLGVQTVLRAVREQRHARQRAAVPAPAAGHAPRAPRHARRAQRPAPAAHRRHDGDDRRAARRVPAVPAHHAQERRR